MPTPRETILAALHARLSALLATVLRGEVLPERVPGDGLLIPRDGEPGEPEVTLSPLRYHYQHRADNEAVGRELHLHGERGLVTKVELVTIAASTYMITYSRQLYAVCEPLLGIFERKGTPRKPSEAGTHRDDGFKVIVFGLGRFGTAIGKRLKKRGIAVLVVGFNPFAVRRLHELGLQTEFGDASDPEFVAELSFASAEWIVSTIPICQPGSATKKRARHLSSSPAVQDPTAASSLLHITPRTPRSCSAPEPIWCWSRFRTRRTGRWNCSARAVEEEHTEIPSINTEERMVS